MLLSHYRLSEAAGFLGRVRTRPTVRRICLLRLFLPPLAFVLLGLGGPHERPQPTRDPAVPLVRTDAGAQTPSGGQRALAEQKLKLLEAYLGSDSSERLAQSDRPEVRRLLTEAQESFESARRALVGNQSLLATTHVDRGLRAMAKASAIAGKPKPVLDEKLNRDRYTALQRQIRSYLTAIEDVLGNAAVEVSHETALDKVEALLEQSGALAESKEFAAANALLAEAYPLTLRVVSDLHQGRTSIARLEFASAGEEFDYERKRYESYEMLVAIALNQAEGDRAAIEALANRYLAKGRLLHAKAEQQAGEGRHPDAIETMERATRELVHALRASGVAIPD